MFRATQKPNFTGNITLSIFESFKKELNEFLKDKKYIKYSPFQCRKNQRFVINLFTIKQLGNVIIKKVTSVKHWIAIKK